METQPEINPKPDEPPLIPVGKVPFSIAPSSSASNYGYKHIQLLKTESAPSIYTVQSAVSHHLSSQFNPNYQSHEFSHATYSALTSLNPVDSANLLVLRQQKISRQTELLINIKLENDNELEFCKTLSSIMKNIAFLCSRTRSHTWGKDGWQKVIIQITADRHTVHPRTLSVLNMLGVYHEQLLKTRVAGKSVCSHVFEYTTQFSIDPDMAVQNIDVVPCQIIFHLNEKPTPTLHNHKWFFTLYSHLLNPRVCSILDVVGAKLSSTSLYYIWKAFDRDPHVGGVCIETRLELKHYGLNLINPLVAIQNFMYKSDHILNKPTESILGYIPFMRGAISAYRLVAIQGYPLDSYLGDKQVTDSIWDAVKLLASDHELCLQLFTKKGHKWHLKYISSTHIELPVPVTLSDYFQKQVLLQNSELFTIIQSIVNVSAIFQTTHSFVRKALFLVQSIFHFLTFLFNCFLIGNLFLIMNYLGRVRDRHYEPMLGPYSAQIFNFIGHLYALCFTLTLVTAMGGGSVKKSNRLFISSIVFYTLLTGLLIYMTGAMVYSLVPTQPTPHQLSLGNLTIEMHGFVSFGLPIVCTGAMYVLSALLYREPWHILTSLVQNLLFIPSYYNIVLMNALCNLHEAPLKLEYVNREKSNLKNTTIDMNAYDDIDTHFLRSVEFLKSPRSETSSKLYEPNNYLKGMRTGIVTLWLLTNAFLVILMSSDAAHEMNMPLFRSNILLPYYLQFIFYSIFGLTCFRFIGSMLYLVQHLICG